MAQRTFSLVTAVLFFLIALLQNHAAWRTPNRAPETLWHIHEEQRTPARVVS